jgi:hypothetical protein
VTQVTPWQVKERRRKERKEKKKKIIREERKKKLRLPNTIVYFHSTSTRAAGKAGVFQY